MKKTLLIISILAMVGFAGILTSCRESFDYEEAYRQNPEFVYRENFEKAFGAIDPDQSWDFTRGVEVSGTRAITDVKIEPISGLDFGIKASASAYNKDDGTKEVTNTKTKNNALFDELTKLLPDGKKHEGEEAVLTAPSTGFLLYPISCQGGYTHDLYIKVGNNPEQKVYSKTWTKWDQGYVNGSYVKTIKKSTFSTATIDQDSKVILPGVYVEAPVGTPIQIYLKNVKKGVGGDKVYSKLDFSVGTGTGNAILVNCTKKPEGLSDTFTQTVIDLINKQIKDQKNLDGSQIKVPDDSELKFIGIEDNYNEDKKEVSGDKDYNDVTLVLVGAWKVPVPLKIEDDGYDVELTNSKRYMVEDLGATSESDIDFNDVVIDFVKTTTIHHTTTITNGVITKDEASDPVYSYNAKVRALGGTKNLAIYLGKNDYSVGGKITPGVDDKCIFVKEPTNSLKPDLNVDWSRTYTYDVTAGTTASVMYNTKRETTKSGDGVYDTSHDCYIAEIDLDDLSDDYQWDPTKHNLYVKVYEKGSDQMIPFDVTSGTAITFPQNGDVPAMIAVTASTEQSAGQNWNYERVNVFKNSETGCFLKLTNGDKTNHPEYDEYPINK